MILRLNYDENYDFEEKQLGKYAQVYIKYLQGSTDSSNVSTNNDL